jgi:hypothetical protein
MTRRSILLLLLVSTSTLSFSQKLGDYYVSIPSESTLNWRLMFLSDSTVELSNVPRHMGGRFTMTFRYITTDTTIEVLSGLLTKQDSLSLNAFGLDYFIKPFIKMTKIDDGFIDYSKALIYIREKYFVNNPGVAFIIDGKTFIQAVAVADGYGGVEKSPKTSKTLQKKLKGINKDNCTIEIVTGLEAYKRYGIKRGAVVITTKQ